MRILGIETSCDETSAAVIEAEKGSPTVKVLSNVVSTSVKLHAKTGGIIPEIAAREQIKYILPVIEEAIRSSTRGVDAQNPAGFIDAIAVTYGPGLIGSLLVGVETAKTLSYVWNKPLVPVNHLYGHIYANFIEDSVSLRDHEMAKQSSKKIATSSRLNGTPRNDNVQFPALALIVSGGHTDLVLLRRHGDIQWLGGTRDDAAGEAFDKIGRLLDLPYPAGPEIERFAKKGDPKAFNFPRPMIGSDDFDFSFSGLKTAVFRETQTIKQFNNETISNICASVQAAIIDVIVKKTLKAAEKYQVKSILLGGGVAANQALRVQFQLKIENLKLKISLSVPPKSLCTDNGGMIAAAAFFNYKEVPWKKLTANPELYFD